MIPSKCNWIILAFLLALLYGFGECQPAGDFEQKTSFLRMQVSEIVSTLAAVDSTGKLLSVQELIQYMQKDAKKLLSFGYFYVPFRDVEPNATAIQQPSDSKTAAAKPQEKPNPNNQSTNLSLAQDSTQPGAGAANNTEKTVQSRIQQNLAPKNQSPSKSVPVAPLKTSTTPTTNANDTSKNATPSDETSSPKQPLPTAQTKEKPSTAIPSIPSSLTIPTAPPSETIPTLPTFPALDFIPTNAKPLATKVVSKQFSGISLYHDVPTNFKVGQIFRFNGVITDATQYLFSTGNQNTISVVFAGYISNEQFKCTYQLQKGQYEFDFSCKIGNVPGRYFLGVFAGRSGQSSSKTRQLNSNTKGLAKTSQPPVPSNIKLSIVANDLVLSWDSVAALTKIIFLQGGLRVQYILSNTHTKFLIPFKDFEGFKSGDTRVLVYHANSQDESEYSINSDYSAGAQISFKAIEHKYSKAIDPAVTQISPPIPWRMDIGQKLTISGKIATDINSQVLLIAPSLAITKVYIGNSNLKKSTRIVSGTPFNISFNLPEEGTYVVEINAMTGQAIINQPVYVGPGYPLIPDFEDLQEGTVQSIPSDTKALQTLLSTQTSVETKEPSFVSSVEEKRLYLLNLTNVVRGKYKAGAVYLDNSLNQLAQRHSDDMSYFNYLSHTDRLGRDPGARAQALGILSSVGENVAQASSLSQAHLLLERSAAHLSNTINPLWTRVGIGISRTYSGVYYIAYEYSSRDLTKQPLTPSEIAAYQNQLVRLALKANSYIKKEDNKMSKMVTSWMASGRSKSIFQYLFDNGFNKSMGATNLKVTYRPDWLDKVEQDTSFLTSYTRYDTISVGVAMANPQVIESYFVFS